MSASSEFTASSEVSHPHHVPHGHDFAAANQAHFDHHAKEVDVNPLFVDLGQRVFKGILDAYPSLFDPESTSVLDFACGTGLVSREVYTQVKSVTGVDISQGSVDQYNLRAKELGVPPERMRAIKADLSGNSELEGQKFDVILCTSSYHHFPDVRAITRTLASFLKPGGSLLVVDWFKSDSKPIKEELQKTHGHIIAATDGFSEGDMRSIFEDAGLKGFEFNENLLLFKYNGHALQTFLARAF